MVFLCVQSLSFTNSSEDHQQTPLVQPYPYRAFQCLKRYFIYRRNIFFKLTIIFPRVPGQESKVNDKSGGHPMIDSIIRQCLECHDLFGQGFVWCAMPFLSFSSGVFSA
jgi:hypothetical protein